MQKTFKTGSTAPPAPTLASATGVEMVRGKEVCGEERERWWVRRETRKKSNTGLHRIPSSLAGCHQNIRGCGGTKTTRVVGKWERQKEKPRRRESQTSNPHKNARQMLRKREKRIEKRGQKSKQEHAHDASDDTVTPLGTGFAPGAFPAWSACNRRC